MAEQYSSSDIQPFLVARFAEWAGDLEYSRSLYARVAPGGQYLSFPEKFESPLEVIHFVSTLRAARLGEPLPKETVELAYRVFSSDTSRELNAPKPLQLSPTSHLRGVIHRTGIRDFEMRAYLTALDYEQTLYAAAANVALASGDTNTIQQLDSGKKAYFSPGGAWVIEGELFQKVAVTAFGLIKSVGRWTRRKLPESSDDITSPFQIVLNELDPSKEGEAV